MTELLHQIILEIYLNTIEFGVEGIQDLIEMPNMPKMEVIIEGVFQYEPMAMYMKQTMKMPLGELGLSPEKLAKSGLGEEMVTEMVWLDNAIYQKNPMYDQWIVQDLTGIEEMTELNNLMQFTPQQSMDMMHKARVINIFGEDVEKDGKEYYTIKNYIDAVLNNIEAEYYIDTLIDKETLLSDYIYFELNVIIL